MTGLGWAAALLLVGLALTCLEIFVPSGGVIGFMAGLAVVAGIGLAFWEGGASYGLGFCGVALVAMPIILGVGLHYWPRTPLGRRILLDLPSGDDALPDNEARTRLKDLIGQTGEASSQMLPSGSVWVGGQTVDAVSEGMAIDLGQKVRVVEVHGNRVVVRPLTGEDERAHESPPPASDRVGQQFDDPFI